MRSRGPMSVDSRMGTGGGVHGGVQCRRGVGVVMKAGVGGREHGNFALQGVGGGGKVVEGGVGAGGESSKACNVGKARESDGAYFFLA